MQETDQQPEIEIKREWYYTDAKLKALRDVIREKNIGSFTIPPLGSGLGGLNWSEVCPRIAEALRGFNDLRILVFEPGGAPETR